MTITLNLTKLMKQIKRHPKRNMEGYFLIEGQPMTHEEVIKTVFHAVTEEYDFEANIPEVELKAFFEK